MSFDALEKSGFGAEPYELYLFQGTGVTYLLTSADEQITHLGQQYNPTTISRSEVEQSNEVISGQMKVFIPKNHPLALLMLPYLPSSPISLTLFASHYGDSETAVIFTGDIASARFTDQCELTLNSEQYELQRKIPFQLYQAPCSHVFGDDECGINLADHTYAGTITAIDSTGTVLTIPAFASIPDSLQAGFLTIGTQVRMIVAHAGNQVTLLSPVAGLEVSTAIQGTAGCRLTYANCEFYKNIRNFLGFDLMPKTNPFDGSASVG
jgi:hypothetical protein